MTCRLCLSDKLTPVSGADNREYFLCDMCKLISAAAEYFLTEDKEKARYLTHNNGIEHKGYVEFLNRAITPALNFLNKKMQGLDYGCGPVPTLSKILARKGYLCENYDPLFVENDLNKTYDFIFSTEVFEHFFYPLEDIMKIYNLLNTGGILVVMTERWKDIEKFKSWYYTKDTSHVAFYSSATFDYVRRKFNLEKLYDDGHRVIILKKL